MTTTLARVRRAVWRGIRWAFRGATLEVALIVVACAAGTWKVVQVWRHGQQSTAVLPGVRVGGVEVGGQHAEALERGVEQAARQASARKLELCAGELCVGVGADEVGAQPQPKRARDAALRVGRTGQVLADVQAKVDAHHGRVDVPIVFAFDEEQALQRLRVVASQVETPSLPARFDFDARTVVPPQRGVALLSYDSLSSIATGLAAGASRIELATAEKPAVEHDPLQEAAAVATLDISVVLGSFDTPYRTDHAHRDRTHNLKVGAQAIDAYVLGPGETFSFNSAVGERSAENGYRYGTGISGGQLIDVLGGGICQVSSTLFGAGFFAGLEIVEARPHSRPSSYVDMGLDSTVVWPNVDLKLRNPYDFAVVLHMTVSRGTVHAEVLGPTRPYQVAFTRTVEQTLPFRTVWRDDNRLRVGTEALAQRGRRGFEMQRTRKLLQNGSVVAEQDWTIRYPATTKIVRRGTNPDGNVPKDKPAAQLRDPDSLLKIVQ